MLGPGQDPISAVHLHCAPEVLAEQIPDPQKNQAHRVGRFSRGREIGQGQQRGRVGIEIPHLRPVHHTHLNSLPVAVRQPPGAGPARSWPPPAPSLSGDTTHH